jgi:hypothetical protein
VDKGLPHRGQIENEYDTLFPQVSHVLLFIDPTALNNGCMLCPLFSPGAAAMMPLLCSADAEFAVSTTML